MANKEETYHAWLNNALAMEKDVRHYLEGQTNDLSGFTALQNKVNEHLDATKNHVALLESCIARLGIKESGIKSFFGKVMGSAKSLTTEMMGDKVIKHTLANYATEHLEIASYKSLMAAAEEVGDSESVAIYQKILADEVEMADWLSNQLPTVTKQFLQKES